MRDKIFRLDDPGRFQSESLRRVGAGKLDWLLMCNVCVYMCVICERVLIIQSALKKRYIMMKASHLRLRPNRNSHSGPDRYVIVPICLAS